MVVVVVVVEELGVDGDGVVVVDELAVVAGEDVEVTAGSVVVATESDRPSLHAVVRRTTPTARHMRVTVGIAER